MNKQNSFFAAILSSGLILSTLILSYTLYAIKAFDNTIIATGSTKQAVRSDAVHWRLEISRIATHTTMKSGTAHLSSDLDKIIAFFTENGVSQNTLSISPVMIQEVYEQNTPANHATKYRLHQTIDIQSKDVDKLANLGKKSHILIEQGVLLQANPQEYYYSKLPELRVSLLEGAMADALMRASTMAKNGGEKVGRLTSVSAGAVQVLSLNSSEVSNYGTYDTSQIEKEVMVSVRATFSLK